MKAKNLEAGIIELYRLLGDMQQNMEARYKARDSLDKDEYYLGFAGGYQAARTYIRRYFGESINFNGHKEKRKHGL